MEKQLTIEFTARYETLGSKTTETREIWICLHGYGQLVQFFQRKFHVLADPHRYFLFPEGLSRFYLDPITPTGRASNKVGATWMTRENRLTDIHNYLTFLDTLASQEIGTFPGKVILLGFSQGAATACRWAEHTSLPLHSLILWSGAFPEDLEWKFPENLHLEVIYGDADPILGNPNLMLKSPSSESKIQVNQHIFAGGHEIPPQELVQLANRITGEAQP